MRPSRPLLLSGALVVLALVVITATAGAPAASRTASVYDTGPGGASALRRYLEVMGAHASVLQGRVFATRDAKALFVLGAAELFTTADVAAVRSFVRAGGVALVATDRGLSERPLLDAYGIGVGGIAAPGTHALDTIALADPPARSLAIDGGISLALPAGALILATDGTSPVAAAIADGEGMLVVVGSLRPFLNGGLGEADNARFVLDLVRGALGGATVAFDEYHHGYHPSSDVVVLLAETWPGRALVFITVVTLVYLVLSGRRLGPPIPLETRPARSSLEYVRSFAGLVRRSGHGEIARRRLRGDLHRGLARVFGLDPATPFERVLARVAASDAARAARARALDDALARPLRDEALLRTVGEVDRIVADPHGSEGGRA